MGIFKKKTLSSVLNQIGESSCVTGGGEGMKRSLSVWGIIAFGIGSIIGAGLFVRTAQAAAFHAGAAVTISFVLASIGCLFAGLCYAEFASMIPVSGSAYTYAYVTLGEFVAWVIGWCLIQEYALGATTLSIAWSEYFNNLLGGIIPYEWIHSPFERLVKTTNVLGQEINTTIQFYKIQPGDIVLKHGYFNLPAVIILGLITMLLIKGTSESALFNNFMVIVKISIVLLFVVIGWQFINPTNYENFLIPKNLTPHHNTWKNFGWGGVLAGAGYVFFSFIGFDAVSTTAQEAKKPQITMPIGILGSLAICTVLYVLFAYVLTGVTNYTDFIDQGKEASVAYAISTYMKNYHWLKTLTTVAIIVGFTTVILTMLYAQSRILYSMGNDGLIPSSVGRIHKKYKTPHISSIVVFIFSGSLASILPIELAGDLASFGTLFAFVIVCSGILVMRKTNPHVVRPFKTPFVPIVPILGILTCFALLVSLDSQTQKVSFCWILLGVLVYFLYSRKKSRLK